MTFNLPRLMRFGDNALGNDTNRAYSIIDELFSNFAKTFPVIDISSNNSEYLIEVELPGVDQKDVEARLDDNILTIKGKKEETDEHKGKDYYARERFFGSFQRSIKLPKNIVKDSPITANFKNGTLYIKVPKNEDDNHRKIEIK